MVTRLRLLLLAIIPALLLAFAPVKGQTETAFPALTGRVVDGAQVISPLVFREITEKLKALEDKTSDQFVVVTLPSLQGLEIEDYGYQLGRRWGIGQKALNNGVLLIVAPVERKVRIEVGYGLEPVLTDALSSDIINTAILPEFREGELERGILRGTEAVIAILGSGEVHGAGAGKGPRHLNGSQLLIGCILFYMLLWLCVRIPDFAMARAAKGGFGMGSSSSGIWSSLGGGFGGGGFSGGGSFGGGGASGSW